LEIAYSQKSRFSALKQWLSSKWKKQAPKNSLRYYVFLSFIPYRLAVKISNRLFTYPKISKKVVGAVIAICLLVGILSFTFLEVKYQIEKQQRLISTKNLRHFK
jgi:hypothetical protein